MKKIITPSLSQEDIHDLAHQLKLGEAELSLINTVQEGIISGVSIQEIFNLVGDRIRELFDAQVVVVCTFNFEKNTEQFQYVFEEGKTHSIEPRPIDRLRQRLIETKGLIHLNKNVEEKWTELTGEVPSVVRGTKLTKSALYLPMVTGETVQGYLSLQNIDRENAFSTSDVRLLTTLANSMSVALENARLLNETSRLQNSKLQEALTDLKSAQEKLLQQEKLASLGQLTAGIAHEIKNPLNFVNNFAELNVELIEEVFEELKKLNSNEIVEEIIEILQDVKSNLKKIHQHGTRADGIVKSMLQHSRGGSGKIEPTDLNTLIKEYVNLSFHGMRAGKKAINVAIDLQLDEEVGMVPLIGADFSRVILNICNNAFDAMREKLTLDSDKGDYKAKLTVKTWVKEGQVHIHIEDNGPGIPVNHKDKILQPFFTTKKGTDGTGLGLSITHDIIKAHKGMLDIDSDPGSYTRFIIILPNNR